MVITLVQGNTAFHFLCARRYETCPRVVVEIGAIICVKRNMNPSELFESDLSSPVQKTRLQVVLTIHTSIPNVAKYPSAEIIEEIQTILRKQKKSARK